MADMYQSKLLPLVAQKATGAAFQVPDGDLTGRTVRFAGAFAIHSATDAILVTPATLAVAP